MSFFSLPLDGHSECRGNDKAIFLTSRCLSISRDRIHFRHNRHGFFWVIDLESLSPCLRLVEHDLTAGRRVAATSKEAFSPGVPPALAHASYSIQAQLSQPTGYNAINS